MKAAAAKKGDLPPGNWIHQFVTFRDIVDALKVGMRITGTLQRATLAANLRHEIAQNLGKVTFKGEDGVIRPVYQSASAARSKVTGELMGESLLTGADMAWLGYMLFNQASIGTRLSTIALHEAVTSGVFLDFDRATSRYAVGLPQRMLLSVLDAIRLLNLGTTQATTLAQEIIAKYRGPGMVSVTHHIRNSDIMAAVILHDTLHNFTEASAAVLRYLSDEDEGQLADFKAVPVAPVSEFAGDEGVLPSVAEIMAWAGGPRGDSVRGADLPKRPVRRRPKP